jgi:hypothetical protein
MTYRADNALARQRHYRPLTQHNIGFFGGTRVVYVAYNAPVDSLI